MKYKLLKNPISFIASSLLLLCGCGEKPSLKTVTGVDIKRFMGDWYVIANIPTFLEKGAHNAVESYSLDADGTIATTFTFRKGGFDGPVKTYHPRGFIRDPKTNAVWDMQFLWPLRSEYLIIYLSRDYSVTVIGRSKLDYVWIMARRPAISEADYRSLLKLLADVGYDVDRVRKVPQKWD
ncbi:MAG: lipocalin family protein [Spirochaetes bacterium]|nr:lipocalin family protein [Spirochaetota bacterium]